MNPLRLTLRNFIGIRSGLGLDEVTLDLTMPGNLIALTGPNGCGKTTIIDNLTPYRFLASRASSYSPGGFSYYDHTYGVAQKILRWEHEGHVYESNIVIKGATKTKTQECYLHQVVTAAVGNGEVLQPVTLPDGTTSDGKAAVYDRCVEHLLGSPELYYTATFSCQGRRTLADYTNGDIKALMSELLNLDTVLALGQQSNDVVRAARNQLVVLRERANDAANVETLRGQVALTIAEVETQLVYFNDAREQRSTVLAQMNKRLAEAQAGAAAQADTIRRAATLNEQKAAIQRRLTEDLKAHDDAARAAAAEILQAKHAAKDHLRSADAHITATNDRIERGRELIASREEVEQRIAVRKQIAEVELPAARAALAEAEKIDADIRAAEAAIETARATLNLINQGGKAVQNTYDGLCARAKLVDEVPCHGTDLQGKCKLLAEAVTARAGIPATQAELEAKRAERATARTQLDAAVAARVEMTAKDTAALAAEVRRLEALERAAAGLETKLEQIDAAQLQLDADRQALAQLQEAAARLAADLLLADSRQDEAQTIAEKRTEQIRATADDELSILQAELDALPPTDAEGLRKAEAAAQVALEALAETERQITEQHARLATLNERARYLEEEAKALAADVERARKMEDEVAQWTLLSKALGPDGIVALCIDDAGPTLTTYCNDLLSACYGPRFSVAIQTQRETKDGTLRETFDIIVYDAERGDEKSIRDVSGGERIWINECMTRAIALYQAEASGRRYGCLFADESDGALDTEKKRQYASMKRRVIEIGGYTREIYISHSPEVREAADAVINVTDLVA